MAPDESRYAMNGRSLIAQETWLHLARILRLSAREIQIVQRIFDDQTSENIASELGISPHTVTTYFERLYTKLHVSSRSQVILVVLAEYLALLTRVSDAPATVGRVTREDLT